MRKTGSMRRAKRWLAESRAGAAAAGQTLDATTVAWFEHMMTCPDCELRDDNDPRLCEVADAILDGTNDDADDLAWMSAEARP